MAQVLNILAPDYFNPTWLSKVTVPVKENKRLKVNNIRKVVSSTVDYLKDVTGMQLAEFPVPDVNKVVEGDKGHVGRLLQLILGVAINCGKQTEHIQMIMEMEEEVQRVVMMAIQELHGLPTHSINSLHPIEDDTQVKKLIEDMEKTREEKERLAQRCHELEMMVNLLQEEKSNISAEYEHLQAQVGSQGTGQPADSGIRYIELKKENETLKQEVESMEATKYELQSKVDELTGQLEESEEKQAELQKLADQSRTLKDEVDILRETSEKVTKYEGIIETYKKKLEDLGDMKRQIKYLEEKNNEYMQNNLDLEEELGKVSVKKPQLEVYKKEINELNAKLSEEHDKADKLSFENAKLFEKLETLSAEKDRILAEKNALKEMYEEEKLAVLTGGQHSPEYSRELGDDPDSAMLENIPASVKERLARLQRENKQLRSKVSSSTSSEGDAVLQTMIDDLKEREQELSKKNRESNKRILELEAKLIESSNPPPRIPGSREELELKLAEANKKISIQHDNLQKKEMEMAGMEERYKKYIEKAKSVIKTLDPKHNPNAAPEINILRAQISEKDKVIDELEKESEKSKSLREMEEKLMATAFYDLGMKLQRGAVESRLANLSQGNSYLARQRQVNARKQNFNNQENYDY